VPRLPAPASDDAYLNQKPEDAKTTKKLFKGLSRQQMKMGGKMIDTKPNSKKTKEKNQREKKRKGHKNETPIPGKRHPHPRNPSSGGRHLQKTALCPQCWKLLDVDVYVKIVCTTM
jgi:hypothetical protein